MCGCDGVAAAWWWRARGGACLRGGPSLAGRLFWGGREHVGGLSFIAAMEGMAGGDVAVGWICEEEPRWCWHGCMGSVRLDLGMGRGPFSGSCSSASAPDLLPLVAIGAAVH